MPIVESCYTVSAVVEKIFPLLSSKYIETSIIGHLEGGAFGGTQVKCDASGPAASRTGERRRRK